VHVISFCGSILPARRRRRPAPHRNVPMI
jgi:hypothetical protein